MNLEQLYQILDLEQGEDFQYFENFADLVESDENIESELLYQLLEKVDLKTFAELAESYFYDLSEQVPGEEIDLYNLLETIKRNLVGMADAARQEEEGALVHLTDELVRFHQWFALDQNCECRDGQQVWYQPVRDAITDARMEKIGGRELTFDFAKALEYPMEEYVMRYGDLTDES